MAFHASFGDDRNDLVLKGRGGVAQWTGCQTRYQDEYYTKGGLDLFRSGLEHKRDSNTKHRLRLWLSSRKGYGLAGSATLSSAVV